MATFTVLNGAGVNGAGVQFGALSDIASSGVAGFPVITPTTGTIFFNDTGLLSVDGTGMSFIFPSTFGGTATSLTYSRPAVTPIFSVTGMNTPLATVADLIDGGAEEMDVLAAIFSGNDTMTGSTQGDWLFGFNGADTVNGGGGADMLSGGAGADAIDGGDGFDFSRYDFSTAGVTIGAADGSVGVGGEAQGDVINNIEGLVGSQHADTLTGDGDSNQIWGHGGDDNLSGGGGIDFLVGGAGVDDFTTFAADVAANVFDFIYDFTDGAETIVLSGWNPASVLSFESNGHVFITSSAVGFTGGVAVLNATLAQAQDQIVFA